MPTQTVTTKVPVSASVFAEVLGRLQNLIQEGSPIGEVHFPSQWNNWGDSEQRPGHIRPSDATKAELVGDNYEMEPSLRRGEYNFKPVVITTDPDEDGFCGASWIDCPPEGHGEYTCNTKRGNWVFQVS